MPKKAHIQAPEIAKMVDRFFMLYVVTLFSGLIIIVPFSLIPNSINCFIKFVVA